MLRRMKVVCGCDAIITYWVQRFAENPAGELHELQINGGANSHFISNIERARSGDAVLWL
jgi:hypothetical protein